MTLLRGRKGGLADLGSGDGRIVSISKIFGLLFPFTGEQWVLSVVTFNPLRSWKPIDRVSLLRLVMSSTPGLFAWLALMRGEQAVIKKCRTDGKISGRFELLSLVLWH